MALGDMVVIKVVLCEGAIGDWAAYAGPADWTDERVKDFGNKLDVRSARRVALLGGQEEWTDKPYRE